MRRSVATLVLAAALAGPSVAPAAEPDLVLHGGRVWTGTGAGATALAVSGERITAVGRDAELLRGAGPGTKLVDLRGGWVGPGFTDNHVHVLEQGESIGTLEPSWSGYNAVSAEGVRAALFGYHAGVKAANQTPEDPCSASEVTEELKAELVRRQHLMLRQGLTTTVEAGLSDIGVLRALRELEREGRLRHRFLVRVGWGCIDEAVADGFAPGSGGLHFRILGVKLYSDGWLGPRSAALREPYNDRPGNGFLFLSQARADADVMRARGMGFNVTTHAIGDLGMETTLKAYAANGVGAGDRAQVEHAQVLADDLIERFRGVGAIASIQYSFATTDQRFAESALGPERSGRAYAWRTLRDRGVRLAGGSDFPVEVINPLWGLQRVVTRTEFDGTPPGGWHPEQRLPLDVALQGLTSDGAYARREESQRGTLEPGRFADLVVLREDPFALPADCLAAATVLMTVVNGRIVFGGEQAYPPGDATCPSRAAPAAGPRLAVRSGPARERRTRKCRRLPCGPFTRARARLRGRVVDVTFRLSRRTEVEITLRRRGRTAARLAVGVRERGRTYRLRTRLRSRGTHRVRFTGAGARFELPVRRRRR